MTKRKKIETILILGLAIGAVVLLAGGLSQLQLLPGHPFSLPESQATAEAQIASSPHRFELSDFWKTVIAITVWLLFPLSLLYVILSREARKRILRDILWVASTMFMIYLIIRVLQPLVSLPQLGEMGEAGSVAPGEGSLEMGEFVSHTPPWLVFAISVGLIALALGLLWYLWQRSHRPPESPLKLLAQEAQQAVNELRAGQDLTDTVLRCYREMSRILSERRGLRRHRAMTPREFEHYLEQTGLRSEHIQRLTRLFEGVRYGAKTTSEREEGEAMLCLEAIAQAYGRPS